MNNEEITFVVQGPFYIDKNGLTTNDLLKSIYILFPQSEIIYSTWRGIKEELGFVNYVLNQDPGEVNSEFLPIKNFKRLLVSTSNGIKKATRPIVVKMRSDSLCEVNKLDFSMSSLGASCHNKILIAMHSTPIMAFMLDDKIQIGKKELMMELWNEERISDLGKIKIIASNSTAMECIYVSQSLQLAPEQILFLGYVKNITRLKWINKSKLEVYKSYLIMLRKNFYFISAAKYGFGSLKWRYGNSLKLFLYLLLINKIPINASSFIFSLIHTLKYKKVFKINKVKN